jgi:hypothetical protein
MNLFSNPKLKISIEEKDGIKFMAEEWSGFISSDQFKDLLRKSIQIYKENMNQLIALEGKIFLFADASKMEIVKKDDMIWLAENINPLYEECGFTHQAVVMPNTFFNQQAVKSYEEFSKSGKMLTNVFKSQNEAWNWFCQDKKLAKPSLY